MTTDSEPDDFHRYTWLWFNRDTIHFYLDAIKFYEGLLQDDIATIEADKDLIRLFLDRENNDLEIKKELDRSTRTRGWLEVKISEKGEAAWDFDLDVSHGTIRFMKSVGLLFVQHLKKRRNILASKPSISMYVLKEVDQKISHLEEKLHLGVFENATPRPLLVNDYAPEAAPTEELFPAKLVTNRPRPILIDSIEILDSELRSRCLDLFQSFKQDGQFERLDTVVAEATRILENRLRGISGATTSCIGVELASYAFSGKPPKLTISKDEAEQSSAHLLYRGTFGFVRNHVHHHLEGNLLPERVIQIVGMIDYLIYLAENSERMIEDGHSQSHS